MQRRVYRGALVLVIQRQAEDIIKPTKIAQEPLHKKAHILSYKGKGLLLFICLRTPSENLKIFFLKRPV